MKQGSRNGHFKFASIVDDGCWLADNNFCNVSIMYMRFRAVMVLKIISLYVVNYLELKGSFLTFHKLVFIFSQGK